MSYFRGGQRFREGRFSGFAPGVYIPVYIPGALRGYKAVFYDPTDKKLGELGSDIRESIINSIEFELCEFGCGGFRFRATEKLPFEITYRTRVDLFPYFSSDPWYTGFVMELPKKTTQKTPWEYAGYGYFEQLDWVLVTKSYTNTNLSAIISDIVETIVAPATHIKYNASKIAATTYTVDSISFDHTPAKEALATLVGFVAGYDYGVDAVREFYFQAKTAAVTAWLWAGHHFQDFELDEDVNSLQNRLYVKQGEIVSGSNYVGSVEDAASIAAYGLRESIITVPEVLGSADALVWAQTELAQLKDPKKRGSVRQIFLDDLRTPLNADGKILITDNEGIEYELPIRKAKYEISAQGIFANLELESGIL